MVELEQHPDDELFRIRTRKDLGEELRRLAARRELSLQELERRTQDWDQRRGLQALKRSTVSDAYNGRSRLSRTTLLSLLTVCGEPESRHPSWLAAWEKTLRQDVADQTRVDTANPQDLGIHSAIRTPDSADDLPAYVERDFDIRLRTALAVNGQDRGAFVVLVGGSSSGKTRSLYEAIISLVPDWNLVQPADAGDLLDLKNNPPRRTVFWLDELQRYLGGHPQLSSESVRALIRYGNIVAGTIWPDQHTAWRNGHEDVHRLIKSATLISVSDTLTPRELQTARGVAEHDSRIRHALTMSDAGMTQTLAGGPALVMCWEQPVTPYAKAIITAAADAHRLGVQSPLNEDLLLDAMFGYLRAVYRVQPVDVWRAESLPHVTNPLYGDVSALLPADDGRPGTMAGFTIADYLAQHLRRVRRTEPLPHSSWQALAIHLRQPADLRRLAGSAWTRLRYCYAEQALRRLVYEFHDGSAAIQLADLLCRQDRFEDAVTILRQRLDADPRDRVAVSKLSRIQDIWQRVEDIRPLAEAGNSAARTKLAEILADGGVSDDLRSDAEAGSQLAAERLIDRLADRGCLSEIEERADRGDLYACDVLAEFYAAWGDTDRLRARAAAGDKAAELRLSKAHTATPRPEAAASEITTLRESIDDGDPEAALQLSALLFDLRQADQLLEEVNAGTSGAAERLVALYTAENRVPPDWLARLRAFGLDADGQLWDGTHSMTPR